MSTLPPTDEQLSPQRSQDKRSPQNKDEKTNTAEKSNQTAEINDEMNQSIQQPSKNLNHGKINQFNRPLDQNQEVSISIENFDQPKHQNQGSKSKSIQMYQRCLSLILKDQKKKQYKTNSQNQVIIDQNFINNSELLHKWNNFYAHLSTLLKQTKQNPLQFSSYIIEDEQSDLNLAVVYDDEEQINSGQQQSKQQENLQIQSAKSLTKIDNEEESRILKTPMVKLMNSVYPDSSDYNRKSSEFKFFSVLDDSSFDNTKNIVFDDNSSIIDSLIKLSHAQTELTYLCQYKNWRIIFVQGICKEEVKIPKSNQNQRKGFNNMLSTRAISKTPKFSCRAEVDVFLNGKIIKINGFCEFANNKKQAKHNSSLICLYELYRTIDSLWHEYEAIKMEKPSLIQDQSGDNLSVLINAGIQIPYQYLNFYRRTSFQRLHSKKDLGKQNCSKLANIQENINEQNLQQIQNPVQIDKTLKKAINQFVSHLEAPKKELYYFVAQNKNYFLAPFWSCYKKNASLWEVEGNVKYESKGQYKEIMFKTVARNKKAAQKKISMQILTEAFEKFPLLFQKYKEIKKNKNLY